MEKFLHKANVFFTVKNSLIVIICILSLILIIQTTHRFGGHGNYRGGRQQTSANGYSSSRAGFSIPGMMGGGGMMGGSRGGYGAGRGQ